MRRTARTVLSLSLCHAAAAGLFVRQHAIIKFGGPRKKWPAAHTTASGEFHAIAAALPFLMQNASLIIYINERAADFFLELATWVRDGSPR
jgi:hypothetical protein